MPKQKNDPALKRRVRERDGMRCTECGLTNAEHLERHGKSLHVHRTQPGSPYTVEGCVTLCFACHGPKPKSPAGSSGEFQTALRFDEVSLTAALDAYKSRHRQSRNSAILSLLEQALRASGDYPPKKP